MPRHQRKPKPTKRVIQVFPEGKITESEYLKLINQNRVQLEFSTRVGLDPLTLVRMATKSLDENRKRRNPLIDEVWCVFDEDEHPQFKQAIAFAEQKEGINIAVSSPCFELWLALHAEDHERHVHRHEIQKRCEELQLIDGKSLRENAKPGFIENYPRAKRRATRLQTMHESSGASKYANPSSSVWLLVDDMSKTNED